MSRIIVITGVTQGLGRAMAEGFIEAGHTVVGCGRTTRAIDELTARFGSPHDWQVVDITDAEAVQAWADRVSRDVGTPDLLMNNAATINANANLWDVPPNEFAHVTDVNINGTAYVIRAFVPAMVRRRVGVIVNFSSGWGRSTSSQVAPYCATKWAIEGLTQALSQELPDGMATVALNPGVIHTQMLESCFGSQASSYPQPAAWAKRAVPLILGIGAKHNGKPMTVAG